MELYRIGLATGEWNIEQSGGLAEKMTDYQLFRWVEFRKLQPHGPESEELLHALGYSRVYNAISLIRAGLAGDKNFKSVDLKEFMPSELMKKQQAKKLKSRTLEDHMEQFQYEKDILKRCGKPVLGK